MTVNQRVEALRSWMRDHGVDAYIVPTSDPHNDEYIPPHWMCREWLTGFTGSAGTALVTLQAECEEEIGQRVPILTEP